MFNQKSVTQWFLEKWVSGRMMLFSVWSGFLSFMEEIFLVGIMKRGVGNGVRVKGSEAFIRAARGVSNGGMREGCRKGEVVLGLVGRRLHSEGAVGIRNGV
ncbi:hypothetical protein B0F90DRAFT_1669485 [Multifurca ochricompacta]|uniref:Uncharacterized protein n=1 Tax=Multifurca ochricompacta TaxID=376703 RepID=A0AAD4QLS9_9AGAM|nr:hypothetical protein B0F90DRAFT_1669485 [Multifurca ochricompacta]